MLNRAFKDYKSSNSFLAKAFIIYLPISLIYPFLSFHFRDNQALVILDNDNSYHISEFSAKEEEKKMQQHIAWRAAEVFLDRTPKGLDNPRGFFRIYTKEAQQKALKQLQSEMQNFIYYQIHQKAECLSVAVRPDGDKLRAEIKGQLLRHLIKNMKKQNYSLTFTLRLKMKLNDNLKTKNIYKYAVEDFNYEQELCK